MKIVLGYNHLIYVCKALNIKKQVGQTRSTASKVNWLLKANAAKKQNNLYAKYKL